MKKLTTELECQSCGETTTMAMNPKTGILLEDNPPECNNCGYEFSEYDMEKVYDRLVDQAIADERGE